MAQQLIGGKFIADYPDLITGELKPAVGYKLYTYMSGTTTNQATYSDAGLTAPNTNPVILDTRGEASVFMPTGLVYTFVLKSATGATIWTRDGIVAPISPSDLSVSAGSGMVGFSYVATYLSGTVGKWLQDLALSTGAGFIGFIQSGVSAVLRTVLDKLRETVTVHDFGAVGDGVSDDTAKCQAALTTGKNVRFLSGRTYLITSQLNGSANQSIIIESGATIKVGAAMRGAIAWSDKSNVVVRGSGTLDCNSLATSGLLFQANALSPSDFLAKGITIINTKADATLQYGGVEISSFLGAAGPRVLRATMRNLTLLNTGTHGAIAAYCDGVKFQNNNLNMIANHGFEAVDCTNVVQTGNEVANCLISGLGVGTHTRNWVIAHNIIKNCAGDGSITCEHNSIDGTIAKNIIIDAYGSSGINVSYGTPAAGDLARVQNVKVLGNHVKCKSGVTTTFGINFYSSTGGGLGKGVKIDGNTVDGFNVGIAYQYADAGSVNNNIFRNMTGVNSKLVMAQLATRFSLCDNISESDTGDHAFQILDYAGSSSDRCTISDNIILASGGGTKSLAYIEGTGAHTVRNNQTNGSSHYVQTSSTAVVQMSGNDGPLSSTPYSGSGIVAIGNGNSSQDIIVMGGLRTVKGTAAPSTGTWIRGERCENSAPAVGAPKAWSCTAGGTPGTWVSEGNL